ncbi:hypothetical protein ACGYLO_18120 [Sulfitobacter sp. 1A13353]|jgi:hypothetical protein|uniref:hypothetical protein n=1 Tax=Sulfitobacter sp. 1A13353 TaxID=3368568 RepID=UPI0037466A86
MFESNGRIHIHFSVPFYAGDQLIRSLREIAPNLRKTNISIPDPKVYREIFSRKVRGAEGGAFMPLEVDRMSEALDEQAELLILSFNDFLASPSDVFSGGVIYGEAQRRIAYLRELFPNREMSLFFSAANPGAVMAAMLNSGALDAARAEELSKRRPLWSELVERLEEHHPDLPVVLWSNEDTPVTWPAVLREVLDKPDGTAVPGGLHMAGAVLDGRAREALGVRIRKILPRSEYAMMCLLSDYLIENVDYGRTEFEVDHSGWTQAVIDDFNLIYEQDLDSCLDFDHAHVITLETMLEDREEQQVA